MAAGGALGIYKTNGTVAAVNSIQVVEADDANLAKDRENPKKAPINDMMSYSVKTFTQDNVEYDLTTQVEDETQLNSSIVKSWFRILEIRVRRKTDSVKHKPQK